MRSNILGNYEEMVKWWTNNFDVWRCTCTHNFVPRKLISWFKSENHFSTKTLLKWPKNHNNLMKSRSKVPNSFPITKQNFFSQIQSNSTQNWSKNDEEDKTPKHAKMSKVKSTKALIQYCWSLWSIKRSFDCSNLNKIYK